MTKTDPEDDSERTLKTIQREERSAKGAAKRPDEGRAASGAQKSEIMS